MFKRGSDMRVQQTIRTVTKSLAALLLTFLLLPASSHALLYSYDYVGQPFDFFIGTTYTPANHVTISLLCDHQLLFAPWGEDQNQSLDVLSFVMSDGYQTRNLADGGFGYLRIFDLKPDGAPAGWWIFISDTMEGTGNGALSSYSPDGAADNGVYDSDFGMVSNQGTWTASVQHQHPVPEPSTALLALTGCAGMLAATVWKRRNCKVQDR